MESAESRKELPYMEALGWLSAELAARADAWNGNAPDWFPTPPEWIDLWEQALEATDDLDRHTAAFNTLAPTEVETLLALGFRKDTA